MRGRWSECSPPSRKDSRVNGREMNHFRAKHFCASEARREKPGVEVARLERWALTCSRAWNTKQFESQGDWAVLKKELPQGSRRGRVEGGVEEAVAPAWGEVAGVVASQMGKRELRAESRGKFNAKALPECRM